MLTIDEELAGAVESVCVALKKKKICLCLVFGEGNGTPLQYSCLENPMDGGAWKAAVYGVAEGRT